MKEIGIGNYININSLREFRDATRYGRNVSFRGPNSAT